MTVSVLKKKLVLQAIQVLRDLHKQYYENSSKKKPLLEEEENSTLFLQVMLKKIPKSKLIKMIKMNLPHSLVKDTHEICLITGDLDKKNHKAEIEPDVLHYKTLLENHGITCISEVLTLRQLRTEYKPFEAKQKLLAAYDVFLADIKIGECLPKVLGRHFFKKRKFPIQVDFEIRNLKEQIQKALSTKVFYVTGQGNSCNSEVAYLDMADSEILDNVNAMAEALSQKIPGTWDNVMGIYLKTAKSKAVPLYMSYDSPNAVQLQDEIEKSDVQVDELTTLPNVVVKVYANGRVETELVKEELETVETSFVETTENHIETDSLDPNVQGLSEKGEDIQKLEAKISEGDIINKKTKSKGKTEEMVSDAYDDNLFAVRRERKRHKSKNANETTLTVSAESANITDINKRKISKEPTEKKVPDAFHNIRGKKKKERGKIAVENSIGIEGISLTDARDKRKQSNEEKEEIVLNASDTNSFDIKKKSKIGKRKNTVENTVSIAAETHISDKGKKIKRKTEKNVGDTYDNLVTIEGKKKKGKNKNAVEKSISAENISLTDARDKRKQSNEEREEIVLNATDTNSFDIKKKSKMGKRKNVVENTVSIAAETHISDKGKKIKRKTEKNVGGDTFNNLATIEGKEKGKNKNAVENSISAESESAEGNKKSAFKRKRIEREFVIMDPTESVENNESPIQTTKKRKIEGLNMKRYQSMKESRKSNRKKNQQKAK